MKRSLILIACLLVVAGLWWLFTAKGPSSKTPEASQPSATARPVPPALMAQPPPPPVPGGRTAASNAVPAATPSAKSKDEILQERWNAENSKPLDFYGKVIDQLGAPITGVKVNARVGLYVSFTRSGGKDFFTETDSTGRFSFVGIRGAGAGFVLKKEGYIYDQRSPSSSRPNDYVPNVDKPVVFTMWKLQGAEPMVHAKVHAYVPCDGTATSYDILTGHKAADGDLVLTLTRTPVDIVRGRRFDWKATVELRNGGGVIPINETYPNEAPAEGYEPKLTVEMSASMKGWDAAFERSYYFKSGRVYGRMTVSIQADFQPPPTSFDVEIYANPSGSRNLEFDPAKAIKPKQ
jgi:hypothetical protein